MPLPHPHPLPIMQGLGRSSSGRKPDSHSTPTPDPLSYYIKDKPGHCAHVTNVPVCAWLHSHVSACLKPRDGPSVLMAWHNTLIFFSFLFQMSPKETQVLGPMVLLKPEHHSWGKHLPHTCSTHLGLPHLQPPSSFLKDPPKSPTPSQTAPENSQDNCEHDAHVPQVRGGVSMKEGPEALVGGPPLSPSVVPALSAFRLKLPGRDTTSAPLEDMLFSHSVHWTLSYPHLLIKGLSAAVQPT